MKRLLIIDDDALLLKSLRCVFERHYHVDTALSGEQAAALLQERPPDVILLDVVLPGSDGIEFLRMVRGRHPRLPVVMISGVSSTRTVVEALEIGAYDFIRKPFDIHELRLTISRALHTAELERQVEQLKKQLTDSPVAAAPLKQAVEAFERKMIEQALAASGGISTRAAELLGTTRRILQYRIGKLGIPCARNGD